MFYRIFSVLAFAGCLSISHASSSNLGDLTSRDYLDVLGTSATLAVAGVSDEIAAHALNSALAEINRLELILSNYRPDSEIERLNQARSTESASPDLMAVVRLCETWQTRSDNYFSCKLGTVIDQWRNAETTGYLPDRIKIRKTARALRRANIEIALDGQSIVLQEPIQLNVSGLAKGYIIDRAFEVLQSKAVGARAVKVDIGGDARFWAESDSAGWRVDVSTDKLGIDASMATSIQVHDAAVAASGHYDRAYRIDRKIFSHILQSRDGWPRHKAPTTAVIASTAADADAIATTLATMSPTQGIDWVNGLDQTEALMTSEAGKRITTIGWTDVTRDKVRAELLELEYEIPAFTTGRYRRPYIAIWISNADRDVVRNLLLLGETERWAKKNSNWWRQVGRHDQAALTGLARPTRRPGKYRIIWDGRDDLGRRVEPSNLSLHIEAAREHGDTDYIKVNIDTVDRAPRRVPASGEIGEISLNWTLTAPLSES